MLLSLLQSVALFQLAARDPRRINDREDADPRFGVRVSFTADCKSGAVHDHVCAPARKGQSGDPMCAGTPADPCLLIVTGRSCTTACGLMMGPWAFPYGWVSPRRAAAGPGCDSADPDRSNVKQTGQRPNAQRSSVTPESPTPVRRG